MKKLIPVLILACSLNAFSQNLKNAVYKNPKNSSHQRAIDLMSRMTLIEKQQQLMSYSESWPFKYDSAFFADKVWVDSVFNKGIGFIQPKHSSILEAVAMRNALQNYLLNKSRLGIPALFSDEGAHGLMKPTSTSFPQVIGMACSWDTVLLHRVYTVVANEMRARGVTHALTPVIDITRDPRWGRVEETFGEDPFVNSILGTTLVRALQGSNDGTIDSCHVAATLKHFCGHGQPESGLNKNPSFLSDRYLREFHFEPFRYVIEHANPACIMASYNEIDGVPSHANKWLLKDVLRDEFNFNGLIVSDYNGISDLVNQHHIASTNKEAAMLALNSGVEVDLPTGDCYKFLEELYYEGKISDAVLDSAVYSVLKLKFDMGLFENPYSNAAHAIVLSKSEQSLELALEAAHKSIVLLKNSNNILPLNKNDYKKISVIGPCAKDVFLGGYSGDPYHKVSIFEGLQKEAGNKIEFLWAQGCKLTEDFDKNSFVNWTNEKLVLPDKKENMKLIRQAIEVARKSELIILCVGEHEQLCREAFGKGDAASLDLISQQNELFSELKKLNKPIVVYLMHGRPLSINEISEQADAILDGWYMGQETGNAAADIIFGNVNPSGKLTITVPKSVGQLPMYYSQKTSARKLEYVNLDNQPLYPFGYGLSYSTFEYSNLNLSKDTISKNETLIVSVDIKNTSKVEGQEIAQLYIRDEVASVTQPLLQLRDFSKVLIKPGEIKTVTFNLSPSKFAIWDINMKYSVEPGSFKIMVGRSSVDFITKKVYIID